MLLFLTLLLLLLSFSVLFQTKLLNAVILLGVFSLASSMIYFLIGAPDVAVTEGAIGVAFLTFIYVLALSDQGKLRVMTEEIAPFIYQEKGELRGLEYEMLENLADKLSLDLEIEFVNHSDITSRINSRRANLVAGAQYRGYLKSTDLSYSQSYYSAQLLKIELPSEKERVAVLSNTNFHKFLETNKKNYSEFESLESIIESYNNGEISGFIADSARMSVALSRIDSRIKQESKISKLERIEYCFAIGSEEEDLIEQLNGQIQKMKRTNELENLVEKHLR